MACKSKCGTLNPEQRKILEALAASSEPKAGKEVAGEIGMEPKSVSCRISALKKKGYVESPVRCKYVITDAGKKALA